MRRSRMVNGIEARVRAWARHRPIGPAPRMRTLKEGGGGGRGGEGSMEGGDVEDGGVEDGGDDDGDDDVDFCAGSEALSLIGVAIVSKSSVLTRNTS